MYSILSYYSEEFEGRDATVSSATASVIAEPPVVPMAAPVVPMAAPVVPMAAPVAAVAAGLEITIPKNDRTYVMIPITHSKKP
jgi:hypothetical protein